MSSTKAQGSSDFAADFAQAFGSQSNEIGRFNLAMFGKTGVGKSTLLNSVFGEDVAATGIGEPVTQESHLYMHKSGRLGVLDTRGLELGEDDEKILAELQQYVDRMRQKPLLEQIHVVWYCIRATDRRFESVEEDFIREVSKLGLPVILVMTQVARRKGMMHPDAVTLADEIGARGLPVSGGRPLMVMAQGDPFNDLEGHGLLELLDATFRVAPEGVQAALNAAQVIDQMRKKGAAEQAIGVAVAAAGLAGAVPIPFSDAALLVPIQVTMMASIALTYDVPMDRASAAALAATAAATQAGRLAVTGLIKLVPGLGSVVGGAISASVASAVTFAMGQAWHLVCQRLARGELQIVNGALDNDLLRNLFMQEFKGQVSKRLGLGR